VPPTTPPFTPATTPASTWYDEREPWLGYDDDRWRDPPADQRLRHLVFVDGRLVDSWAEPVELSSYAAIARAHDAEARPVCRHAPLPEPDHVPVLRWLESLVGGRAALESLDDGPTPEVPRPAGDFPSYDEAQAHLERVCQQYFGPEVALVCDNTLARLAERNAELLGLLTGQQVAAGVMWVVGKANVLFGGGVTMTTIARELWVRQPLHAHGTTVGAAVRGAWLGSGLSPRGMPDHKPFGTPTVLTRGVRRRVCEWRDVALAAEAAYVAPVLPSEVES